MMVPRTLRSWFVVHCVVDVLVAVPLFCAPRLFLGALGWTTIDPLGSRLAGAALFGIGIQSFLGRNEGPEAFRAMLNLKIIWSLSAVAGIAVSMAQGAAVAGWIFLGVFAAFAVVWIRYRLGLGSQQG